MTWNHDAGDARRSIEPRPPHPARIPRVALLAVVLATIGCDQISKRFAAVHLMGAPRRSFLGDFLRVVYAENTGAFLSLGSGLPASVRSALFVGGTLAILAICIVIASRRHWPTVPLLGFALVFAGGASNLVDRIARGAVIDFLNLGVGSLRTGIFNVADMAILSGVVLVLVAQVREAPSATQPDPGR